MTFQRREILNYQGQKCEISALPLTHCDRPIPKFDALGSNCWRGYVGTWEIRDDTLHLVQLSTSPGEEVESELARVFPQHAGSVAATWFSGEIMPDDVVHPDDQESIEAYRVNRLPVNFL